MTPGVLYQRRIILQTINCKFNSTCILNIKGDYNSFFTNNSVLFSVISSVPGTSGIVCQDSKEDNSVLISSQTIAIIRVHGLNHFGNPDLDCKMSHKGISYPWKSLKFSKNWQVANSNCKRMSQRLQTTPDIDAPRNQRIWRMHWESAIWFYKKIVSKILYRLYLRLSG